MPTLQKFITCSLHVCVHFIYFTCQKMFLLKSFPCHLPYIYSNVSYNKSPDVLTQRRIYTQRIHYGGVYALKEGQERVRYWKGEITCPSVAFVTATSSMASDCILLIRESLEYLEDTPEIDTVGGCLMLHTFEGRYQLDWIALDWIHVLHSNVVHFRKTITSCITRQNILRMAIGGLRGENPRKDYLPH